MPQTFTATSHPTSRGLLGRRPFAGMEIRVEAFNVFNRAHLNHRVATLNDPLFGRSTGRRGGTSPRMIQLGAKWLF